MLDHCGNPRNGLPSEKDHVIFLCALRWSLGMHNLACWFSFYLGKEPQGRGRRQGHAGGVEGYKWRRGTVNTSSTILISKENGIRLNKRNKKQLFLKMKLPSQDPTIIKQENQIPSWLCRQIIKNSFGDGHSNLSHPLKPASTTKKRNLSNPRAS